MSLRMIPAAGLLFMSHLAVGSAAPPALSLEPVPEHHAAPSPPFDPLLLNIRMSPGSVTPPVELIKQTWALDSYRLGRLTSQEPRAAIIDDDQHHRLLILTSAEEGKVRLYRVGDLPVDVGSKLPRVLKCAQAKDCHRQRGDPGGEMGCLAVCLLESLKE